MSKFQVIGDELQFDGYRTATFRDDLPASVRDRINVLIERFPDPGDIDTQIADELEDAQDEIEELKETLEETKERVERLEAVLRSHQLTVPA